MCSFNIEALALACIAEGVGVATGLFNFFEYSAKDLSKRLTPDPAGVSKAIKINIDQDVLVSRIEKARDLLGTALDNDDDEQSVRVSLEELYWKYLEPSPESESKAAFAATLRKGNDGVRMASSLTLSSTDGVGFKTSRSYGCGDS